EQGDQQQDDDDPEGRVAREIQGWVSLTRSSGEPIILIWEACGRSTSVPSCSLRHNTAKAAPVRARRGAKIDAQLLALKWGSAVRASRSRPSRRAGGKPGRAAAGTRAGGASSGAGGVGASSGGPSSSARK